jgi:hypothetical protein
LALVSLLAARRTDGATHASHPAHPFRVALVCLVAALVGAIPVQAGGTDQPPGTTCVREPEDTRASSAGDSGGEEGGAPPKLHPALYKKVVTLEVTVDGLEGKELPISIEGICDVPRKLAKSAAKLAGSDGIALLVPRPTVWRDGTALSWSAATAALDLADAALVRGRLTRPRAWRTDGDGIRIATFRMRRIEVTD